MGKIQSLKNKLGEVNFRRKLALQFLGKKTVYEGRPTESEYRQIVKDRLKGYKNDIDTLLSKGVILSPFLELGAGVGQASMFLENKYGVRGITSDLSLETLRLSEKFSKYLKFKKIPVRIVCDIYHLPFKSSSLPFIFCYETLHHLPDPYPVLFEINRVLIPGGHFFFNGEPISQVINLNLWRRDRHLRWWEKILKLGIILHFISRIGKSEVENDILEETFDLKTWEKALDMFGEVEAGLVVFPFNYSIKQVKNDKRGWLIPSPIKRFLLEILGGGIGALCQKKSKTENRKLKTENIFRNLSCPSCFRKSRLYRTKGGFMCPNCKTVYPKKKGIYILLPKKEMTLLYPR